MNQGLVSTEEEREWSYQKDQQGDTIIESFNGISENKTKGIHSIYI